MAHEMYEIDNLKKWQDNVMDIAKKILRENGELRPVAFVLTERMNIDEDLQKSALMLKDGEGVTLTNLANADEVKPADTVVLIIDLMFGPEQALEVIKTRMPPEQAVFISALEAQGHKFGVKNPSVGVAKVLMERLDLDIKDVVAMAIELIIKKTDAIAYIKLDETWMVGAKDKTGEEIEAFRRANGGLEGHPDATEAIMSLLETDGLVRMLTVDFRRNRPKTGRVIGFGEPKEILETNETDQKQVVQGRFAHLFDKAKAQPKPAVPTNSN
jgi:hypothetical protein